MGYDGSSSLKRVSPAKKIGIAGIDFTNLTSGNNINNLNVDSNASVEDFNLENMIGSSFESWLANNYDCQEIENDNYTLQSVTDAGDNILISAYSKNDGYSRLYLYNKQSGSLVGKIGLPNKAHVGGVSLDQGNGVLYVSGDDGAVLAFDYKDIINMLDNNISNSHGSEQFKKTKRNVDIDLNHFFSGTKINISKEITAKPGVTEVGKSSTLYYKNGYLYVGTFHNVKVGELLRFKVNYNRNSDGDITSISKNGDSIKWKIPPRTQGVAIYNKNSDTYLVTTHSVGPIANSIVSLFEVENENSKLKLLGQKEINKTQLEGIHIADDGTMFYSFEKTDKDSVVVSSFDKLYSDIKNGVDKPGLVKVAQEASGFVGEYIEPVANDLAKKITG